MNLAAAGDAASDILSTEVTPPETVDGVTVLAPISYDPNLPAREVGDAEYNPAKDREDMRRLLGIGVLVITGVIALVAAIAILAGSTDTQILLTGVFTPLVGLSGAVLGFYFGGGKDANA